MTKKKIIIATGGTGGHVFPALSLANNLVKNRFDIILTTDKRGLKYLGRDNIYNFVQLPSSPLINGNIFKYFQSIFFIIFSILRSLIFLSFNRPNLIFGMGGYSSFPICIAAAILKIKFVIYENNLILGKANKYLLPFAHKIFVSFKELKGISEKNNKKVIEVGNMIREELVNPAFSNTFKKNSKINILVLGGSQGAKIFANKLPEVFKRIKETGKLIKVFQQCQSNQNKELIKYYNQAKIDCEIFNFTNKIIDYYSKANLVITRSGASALGELINVKIPFIAIPLPTSADNHQYINAKFYEKKGFCYFLEEKNISNQLYEIINEIFNDIDGKNTIKLSQSQYSDKDIFKKININIDKIIYEEN